MEYANPHLILTPEQLKDRLEESNVVVLDLRPAEDYANGHVPGARSLDIFGISLIDTGDGPLKAFLWIIEHLIGAKGVSADSTVVIYDRISGERATRLFWFLEFFGHEATHVVDGGFEAWKKAGLPVTQDAETPSRGNFKANPQRERLATADDVLERLHTSGFVIVDTRSEAENNATLVRSARGGHIPGAVHLEWKNNLNADGTFKSADELAALAADMGITRDTTVHIY